MVSKVPTNDLHILADTLHLEDLASLLAALTLREKECRIQPVVVVQVELGKSTVSDS